MVNYKSGGPKECNDRLDARIDQIGRHVTQHLKT